MSTQKIDRDEAFGMLRKYYRQRVASYCVSFLGELAEAIKHDDYDADDLRNNLSGTIEDACIYTVDNAITLAASDNDDAYADNFGTEGIFVGSQIRFDLLAYAAFEADVLELLDRAGFDWDDPEGTIKAALEWLED